MHFPRLLNLIQYYLAEQIRHPLDEDTHARFTRFTDAVTGPLRSRQKAVKIGSRMVKPPAWWRGDEDATTSNLAAMQQLGMRGRR